MEKRLLLIDESDMYRDTFTRILEREYTVEQTADEKKAIEFLSENKSQIVAVLVDMIGSIQKGFSILESITKEVLQVKLPVIVVCNPTSASMEEKLYLYGISECISQPFNDNLILMKVRNVVETFQYRNNLEKKIRQQTSRLEMQNTMLKKEAEILQKSNMQVIELLGVVAEYRNQENGEHIRRIKGYTEIIAEEFMKEFPEKGLTPELISSIVAVSPLYDIGKIAIPDSILLKPGKLTEKEFDCMKSHTMLGYEILNGLKDAWSKGYIKISQEICRYHHERYDGNGYPDGLKGNEIPLSAQIVAVADVYDALVHERVYKEAIPKDESYRMIINGECGVFSPEILKCLTNCRERMEML